MFRVVFILLLLSVASMAVFAESAVTDFIPEPDFAPGWKWDFEPEVYVPDNLYEYINGEAELYNSYTFEKMVTGSYVNSRDDMQTITVDIYDMGSPLDAFGIYSRFRRPGLEFAEIGGEAIVSEYNVRFYKGQYFVQVNSGSREDEMQVLVRDLANDIAAELPGADSPDELTLLPQPGQQPHTLTYHTSGFMGLEAFNNALAADYVVPGDTLMVFVILADDKDKTMMALAAFKESVSQRGRVLTTEPHFSGELSYQGKVMVDICGNQLVGAGGFQKSESAHNLITLTCRGL